MHTHTTSQQTPVQRWYGRGRQLPWTGWLLVLGLLLTSCRGAWPSAGTAAPTPQRSEWIIERNDNPTPFPRAMDVPTLIGLLDDPSLTTRLAALTALEQLGPSAHPAVPAVIGRSQVAASTTEQTYAVMTLGAIGPAASVALTVLLPLAADPTRDATVRAETLTALGRIGSPAAVPTLGTLVADPTTSMRLHLGSAEAIAAITGESFDGRGGRLDEQGQPIMALAAQQWWLETGQYQDWPTP